MSSRIALTGKGKGKGGASMVEAVSAGALDLALTWGTLGVQDCEIVGTRRLAWIAADGFQSESRDPLPLVAFDAPCAFHQAAVQSLDAAGIPFRYRHLIRRQPEILALVHVLI